MDMEHGLAAHYWGWHRLEEFRNIPTDEQAELIAVYRIKNQIEGVLDYEQHLAMKRASRGKG